MNTIVLFAAILASASAGYLHGGAISLQGPSSRTSLVGPDGSHIVGAAPGGSVHHEISSGYVAHSAPALAYAAPVVAHHAPLAVATPLAHGGAVLAGPSGVVSAHGLGLGLGGLGYGGYAGHGLEGQWGHGAEAHYDDGSYKPHVYGH